MKHLHIAVDIGGSHGRVFSHTKDDGLVLQHEFEPRYEKFDDKGNFCWNGEAMLEDIIKGIHKITDLYTEADNITMGIDCFGNDFGLLDENGKLLFPVFHNKSIRNRIHVGELAQLTGGQYELYRITGINDFYYDTANQLLAVMKDYPDTYAGTRNVLVIADLLGYWLTGVSNSERTAMSVTQLYDPSFRNYASDIVGLLHISSSLKPLSEPGSRRGEVLGSVCPFLGERKIDFINIAEHDSASSVMTIMNDRDDMMFISSGTMSVIGCFVPEPVKTKEAFEAGLSNETAVMNRIRLLKNVPGMYIVNECRKEWGDEYKSYRVLDKLTLDEMDFGSAIDVEDPCFVDPGTPDNPMTERIWTWCIDHGLTEPENIGQILVSIYKGLAAKYMEVLHLLEHASDRKFERICIIGGGSKNRILDQLVADCSGLPVYAGPVEASATGNVVMQMMATEECSTIYEGVGQLITDSDIIEFLPRN